MWKNSAGTLPVFGSIMEYNPSMHPKARYVHGQAHIFLLAGSAVFNASANTLMKLAFGHQKDLLDSGAVNAVLRIVLNPWAVAGVGCFGISFVFLSAALTRTDLSLAYPFMAGLVFLLVLAVSVLFFRNRSPSGALPAWRPFWRESGSFR